MLPTAKVLVRSKNGRELIVRALLDQGSEVTFVADDVVRFLGARRFPETTRVESIDEVHIGTAKSRVEFAVSAVHARKVVVKISALVLPRLGGYCASIGTLNPQWEHLHDLDLADPEPSDNSKIQLIIGADYYGTLLLQGVRKGPAGTPTAQATILGWILSGPFEEFKSIVNTTVTFQHFVQLSDLQKDLCRFWEQEELPHQKFLTEEEQKCEEHFRTTHARNSEGRYVVRLPLRDNANATLGTSVNMATAMLLRTQERLDRDKELETEYYSFLQEYEALGHMRQISEEKFEKDELVHPVYLPHHPVIKETSATTRVRVVFNASSRTSTGSSLNDQLLTGPKLHNDITSIVLRWRGHRFVITADICKMFRQIQVDERDVDFQRIICRRKPYGKVVHFQLLTATYGTACAPYLANRVLRQPAVDEGDNYPAAKLILEQEFYVDDVLFGAETIEEARKHKADLTQLLQKGGFQLHKFTANNPLLLNDGESVDDNNQVCFLQTQDIDRAVLGLRWHSEHDEFRISVNMNSVSRFTKRVVLSLISRLFDPLGWVSPIVVFAKIIMQELWLQKLEWDEEIPEDILMRWRAHYDDLSCAEGMRNPRWTGQVRDSTYELHGFADASSKAYAAVVYIRVISSNQVPKITMIMSKTKIAPLKTVSIPRLELCSVVMLAKLFKRIQRDLGLVNTLMYGWTDSAVVLGWLRRHPSTWRTFVANRVSEIHTTVPDMKWRHVPTKDNPADCASRGVTASQLLTHQLWWHGPSWLEAPSADWPREVAHNSQVTDSERLTHLSTTFQSKYVVAMENLSLSVSSWPRLLRVTSYCFRFIDACRKNITVSKNNSHTTTELATARKFWCGQIQKEHYPDEIRDLKNKSLLSNLSSLKTLSPFLDGDGLLRVTGRLNNAPITWDAKHPIILPKHRISELIIEQTHLRTLHGGSQITLYLLRQNFWIIGARNLVRKVIHRCVVCIRQRANIMKQMMGELPAPRVTPCKPFLHTGIDYAGPMLVRLGKGRGYKSQKAYIALFICLTTRAIHLELVSDYTSEGFISACKRFVSRRGLPSHLYSDNGTNFEGADNSLRRAYKKVTKDPGVKAYLIQDNITWHFIPPAAPHFGGLWEAGVKSVKYHLRRIVGNHTLTIEEFSTLLCQVEACLNSRPIAPFSNDPEDFNYLTPGHFLVGAPIIAVPEPSVLDLSENRLS